MRNATENLQHRRHRPMYLAPTALNFQHFSTQSYGSEDYSYDNYDDEESVDDLMIPLFVEIPQDDNLRLPITSPPCSNGSGRQEIATQSSWVEPAWAEPAWVEPAWVEHRQKEQPSRRLPYKERLFRIVSKVYALVYDFLLLIFVCLIGMFFHVEVQVVKERAHGRRREGRIIVQKYSRTHERQSRYQSTDLLQPLHQSSHSTSYSADDMVYGMV